MKATKRCKKIIHFIIILLITIILTLGIYMELYFANESISEIFFYMSNGASNGSMDVYVTGFVTCFPIATFIVMVVWSLLYNVLINKCLRVKIMLFKKKEYSLKLYPFNFITNHKIIFTIIYLLISLSVLIKSLEIDTYVNSINNESTFIEDNYVIPNKNNIKLKKKRNLVYVIVESLETTFFTKKQGGDWDYETIPELYRLLYEQDSVFFSATEKASGLSEISNTGWTTAAVVATNTGLPLKIPIDQNEYYSENFMSGAYALGDYLKDIGYHNEVISASNTSFGGMKDFYTKHGTYEIIDSDNLYKYGKTLKENQRSSWGFNDKYMFDLAKERLLKLSKNEEPFNLTLISIDTHFPDGYIGDYSLNKYKTQYENAYATESKLIYDFVTWIKAQSFYENTTIVIVGDHLSMQSDYFKNNDASKRKRYNVIINPAAKAIKTKNRIAGSIDMYPTILGAMGAKIKDNQLSLGVNLFSDQPTLSEKYGLDNFNKELNNKSTFYNNQILGTDYIEMIVKEER